jgi:transposase
VVERHIQDLERLGKAIEEVEQRLAEVTAADPEVARLQSQPGIGPVTAWTMRAEIGRFDRFRSGMSPSTSNPVLPQSS